MTPAGSWPTTRPGATGNSPRQMCEPVPQMVVVVTFTIASVGPHRGIGTSSMWMPRTSVNTGALIVCGIVVPLPCVGSLAGAGRRPDAPAAPPGPRDGPLDWRRNDRFPAQLAQPVEHFHGKEGVSGSNPLLGSRSGCGRHAAE